MAEARDVKFCTKGDYFKSCQTDDKSPLKGAWFCSRDSFLYASVTDRHTDTQTDTRRRHIPRLA